MPASARSIRRPTPERWSTCCPRTRPASGPRPSRRIGWEAVVDRLGNLTLLERTLNRNVGNAGYQAKRAAYESSGYALAREVADLAPEEWTPALLEARQRRLAARAVRLWRSDFA